MDDDGYKSFDLKVCLDNIDSATLKVIEIIQQASKNIKISYDNFKVRLSERRPYCKECRTRDVSIHQIHPRTLHFYHAPHFEVKVEWYKCNKCDKTFMTNLTLLFVKSANFTDDLFEKLLDGMCESEATLFAIKYRWENTINTQGIHKSFVSHQSIENFLLSLSNQLEPFDNLSSQGYLIFDVQWIKLKRVWKYGFTLYDVFQDRAIADKIYDHEI